MVKLQCREGEWLCYRISLRGRMIMLQFKGERMVMLWRLTSSMEGDLVIS